MNRRTFLRAAPYLSVTAATAGPAALAAAGSEPPEPVYRRFNWSAMAYLPIEKHNVRAGDSVWIENEPPCDPAYRSPQGVYLVSTDARLNPDGNWTFQTSHLMTADGQWQEYPPAEQLPTAEPLAETDGAAVATS